MNFLDMETKIDNAICSAIQILPSKDIASEQLYTLKEIRDIKNARIHSEKRPEYSTLGISSRVTKNVWLQ